MPTIGLVASQNGLGHARRLVHFSFGFKELGYEVSLFLSPIQHKKLSSEIARIIPETRVLEVQNLGLDGPTTSSERIHEASEYLHRHLKNLDFVISDNVTWPGKYLDTFFLMGHFTWIDYWQKSSNTYKPQIEQSLFEAEKISKWFSPVDFSEEDTSLIDVERIKIPLAQYITDSKKKRELDPASVTFSNGTTGLNKSDQNNLEQKFKKIGVNLEIAESHKFQGPQQPAVALGRPGFGTIRDCLAAGVLFLPFWEGGDPELTNNQATLKREGLIPLNWEGNQELNIGLIQECLLSTSHRDRITEYWKKNSAPITEIVGMMGF
jgi:hypothetical protein